MIGLLSATRLRLIDLAIDVCEFSHASSAENLSYNSHGCGLTQTLVNIVGRGHHSNHLLPPCPNMHLLRINFTLDPTQLTNLTTACSSLTDVALPSLHTLVFNVETTGPRRTPSELETSADELMGNLAITLDPLLSGTRFSALQRIVFHIGGPPWKPAREWWLSRIRILFPLCCKHDKVRLTCAQPSVSLAGVLCFKQYAADCFTSLSHTVYFQSFEVSHLPSIRGVYSRGLAEGCC